MTHSIDTGDLLLAAIQAAMQAGNLLKSGYGSAFEICCKPGPHNLVTVYDSSAESIIINTIKQRFPTHAFLAEESGSSAKSASPYLWVIDPLDGTLNFANNIPLFAISIAAAHKKEIVAGVIYLPIMNELFTAEKGKGAYLNGKRLSVTTVDNLEHAVLCTGMPSDIHQHTNPYLASFARIAKEGCAIRDFGSAALNLAYLAAGRVSAYWIDSLQPWDMAAGKLLVEEAGGMVTHYDGKPHDVFSESNLLASNGRIHKTMVKELKR